MGKGVIMSPVCTRAEMQWISCYCVSCMCAGSDVVGQELLHFLYGSGSVVYYVSCKYTG